MPAQEFWRGYDNRRDKLKFKHSADNYAMVRFVACVRSKEQRTWLLAEMNTVLSDSNANAKWLQLFFLHMRRIALELRVNFPYFFFGNESATCSFIHLLERYEATFCYNRNLEERLQIVSPIISLCFDVHNNLNLVKTVVVAKLFYVFALRLFCTRPSVFKI